MAEGTGEEKKMKEMKKILLANDEEIPNVILKAGLHFKQFVKFIFDLHENFEGSITALDESDNFIFLDDGYSLDGVCSIDVAGLIPETVTMKLQDAIIFYSAGEMESLILARVSKAISSKLILEIGVDPDEGYYERDPEKLLLTLSAKLSHNRGVAELYSVTIPFNQFPFISFNMEEYEKKLQDDSEHHQQSYDDETNYSDYAREEDTPTVERMDEGISRGEDLQEIEFKDLFCNKI